MRPKTMREEHIGMFTEMRARARSRRQRATIIRTINAASRPQRDELIVLAQRQGLL